MLLPLLQNLGMLGTIGDQPATFIGPNIATLTLTVDQAMSPRNFAPRFQSDLALTFTINGTLPTGLSLSSAGVLSGTPTQIGTFFPISITAEDENTDTADSNDFAIVVLATAPGFSSVGGSNVSDEVMDIGTAEVSVYESIEKLVN
jgi:hypothetical protein